MLEAFKDARSSKSSVGGPFVAAPEGSVSSSPSSRGIVVFVAAVGLAFVLGVFVGRRSSPGEVQAAGGDDEAAAQADLLSLDDLDASESPWVTADDEPVQTPPTQSANPLLDARNKYTIVAIALTPKNEDIAYDNYDYLLSKGLQAFQPFRTPNGMIVVVVGAAPKESALADSLSRLQRLSGPNGTGRPYSDAYTQPIRKLIDGAGGD